MVDHKFKNFEFIHNISKRKLKLEFVQRHVKNELINFRDLAGNISNHNLSNFFSIYDSILINNNNHNNIKDNIEDNIEFKIDRELEDYCHFNNNLNFKSKSLLLFWKENNLRFPFLSKLTKQILVIQASSAESERNFSLAGFILSAKRSKLKPELLEAIMLLKLNN